MSYQYDRGIFVEVMRNEGVPYGVSILVMRHANTIQRIAALECSVEMSEREAARVEKRAAACERRIAEILAPYNVTADFSGDPRGCCVKVRLPSGRANSWGGDGLYCVPSRDY